MSNFFQGFPCFFENQINKIPSLEYPEDNSKEFFEDLELMNQQFSYLKQLQALKKPNLVKDFKKMVEKQNDKIEDNEDINDLAHKFVEDKLSQKNIRVDWVLKREINCQIVFEEQKELIKEECFIKKSKSKQKMVLRERKKMSFIHFFRNQKERHFSYDNTHMKRYKKVLEKNKNNDDEICVICLGIEYFYLFYRIFLNKKIYKKKKFTKGLAKFLVRTFFVSTA